MSSSATQTTDAQRTLFDAVRQGYVAEPPTMHSRMTTIPHLHNRSYLFCPVGPCLMMGDTRDDSGVLGVLSVVCLVVGSVLAIVHAFDAGRSAFDYHDDYTRANQKVRDLSRDPDLQKLYQNQAALAQGMRNERIGRSISHLLMTVSLFLITAAVIVAFVLESEFLFLGLLISGGGFLTLAGIGHAFLIFYPHQRKLQDAADEMANVIYA